MESGSRTTGIEDLLWRGERSGGGAAAVDGVVRTGDVACIVGGEEGDDSGDFGGLAQPARRNAVDDLVHRRRLVAASAGLKDGGEHAAVDHAGTHAIDPYAG